jgi:hypothetical protein
MGFLLGASGCGSVLTVILFEAKTDLLLQLFVLSHNYTWINKLMWQFEVVYSDAQWFAGFM